MKILFCNYEYPPIGGGGAVVNALLAEELAKKHSVTILTSQGLGLPFEETVGNVRIIRVPVYFRRRKSAANMPSMFMYLPMGISAGKKLLKKESFDVINTHFALPSGPVGNALSRFSGIPNVLSVHGGDLYDPSKFSSPHRHYLLRAWVRRLARNADAVVGQSSNTLQNLRDYYTPEIEGIRIPLGIRNPGAIASSREKYGFNKDDFLFVTIGRLVARKAINQLVDIMGKLGNSKAHLLIVGSGPQESPLLKQVEELGLAGQVHFMGNVQETEKFEILKLSDAFVSTSQHEGFGIVFLEAMATGLPVICYDCGGQNDFLEDGKTGLVLPLNDTGAVYNGCLRIMQDTDFRTRTSDENKQRIRNLYIDNCAKRYEQVFESVICAKKPGTHASQDR